MIVENQARLSAEEVSGLLRRLCEQMGIAFTSNRVFPGLADLNQTSNLRTEVDELNAVGKQFGIRFREMYGTINDLINTVNNSGPVMIRSITDENSKNAGRAVLVLEILSRSRLLIFDNGEDRIVSKGWARKNLIRDASDSNWFLVQPMLAADIASRFHYSSGLDNEPLKPLHRFFAMLKPESQDIRTIVVFSLIIGLLSLTLPLAVEAIVNTIAFGRYLQPLIILSLIVLTFLGFRAGLTVLMAVVVEIVQRKLFVRTVEDLSYRLTRVPLTTWNRFHGPELVNRFFDIVNVQKITSKLLLDTLMLGLQTVIGLTVLAFYHPFLLGYDIGLLAMMTIVLYVMGRGAIKTSLDESTMKYETAAWLQEIVRHPSTFKYNGGLGFAINRADELTAQYINHRQSHFNILIRQITFSMIMQVVAATALLALGGFLVIDGQMTLGQLVAAELIVTVILGSFAKIGKDLESFYDLMASVDKLGKLFDLPVERIDKLQLTRRPGAYGMSLVGFQLKDSYGDCDVELSPGLTYALHGSTELTRRRLIETLVGQGRPCNGHVLLDDFRVDAISAESLQEKISLVREIELFESSVDENIRMGRENVGSQQVNDVVHQLGLRRTLSELDSGLATKISICGFPLSQGQSIRLVLARALISKPGILIVDGLLDRLSDEDTIDVLERLTGFKGDTTIIISTGRLAITQWADRALNVGDKVWCLTETD